jgi:hypothetical protein
MPRQVDLATLVIANSDRTPFVTWVRVAVLVNDGDGVASCANLGKCVGAVCFTRATKGACGLCG